jgi:uncharacterized protein
MIYARTIAPQLQVACFQGNAIILYGARQVGKTTLCKTLWGNLPDALYVTGDDFSIVQLLTNASLATLKERVAWYRLVIIDEAQKVRTIGNTIKLMVDNIPEVQVIATGSSSFDLANHVQEPLTGRASIFHLHPLSVEEVWAGVPLHDQYALLENRIIYGMYPRIVGSTDEQKLYDLAQAYVYKDIFLYESLRKPDLIVKLLQALALQVWSEVSYNELSQLLQVDGKTIQKYIGLLEQAFIVFRLPSFARNMRNEIKRGQKIFFRDTGIRNGLLKNVQPLESRSDKGAQRENFVISERMKYLQNHCIYHNSYFWRTNTGQEIDYIETDHGELLEAYEVKWSSTARTKFPAAFKESYPHAGYQVVSRDNYMKFVKSA